MPPINIDLEMFYINIKILPVQSAENTLMFVIPK